MQAIDWQGESLVLYGDRAVYWSGARTLLVADTHFAKDAVFRRAGIPIPLPTMHEDLARLGRLVEASGAVRVLVLGDFFHAAPNPDEPFAARLADWLDARPGLRLCAIPGNHDRHGGAGALPGRVEWLADGHHEPPFVFRHEPVPDVRGYVLAGHLHPVVRVSTRSRDRFRLPALWLSREWGVLPSFGAFTGGAVIRPAPGDRVFALSPDGVVELGAAARESARA